ncbi:hypothetical protein RN001_001379 [Aquatica leii]|uniref:Zinc finger MYM-type protein 1 n=1 Tax=Aquatica leii TaxID=1421715 RepID=A0AAN7QMU9_9COLE|nr:hypothetical protein RN001_001379 [Aquatica leii]
MLLEVITEFDSFLVNEVKKAKYFSLVVDSTPDLSHVDQLATVIRYVKEDEMFNAIIKLFECNGLDIRNCRRQSYDNASNMSGVYSGLQARIKELNSHADFIPCFAHSLNLVGTNAADNDACKALRNNWQQIQQTLLNISEDLTQKAGTRAEASGLAKKTDCLETAFMTEFWGFILQRLNDTNKKLQSTDIDLTSALQLYDSLINLMTSTRNEFDYFEKKPRIYRN